MRFVLSALSAFSDCLYAGRTRGRHAHDRRESLDRLPSTLRALQAHGAVPSAPQGSTTPSSQMQSAHFVSSLRVHSPHRPALHLCVQFLTAASSHYCKRYVQGCHGRFLHPSFLLPKSQLRPHFNLSIHRAVCRPAALAFSGPLRALMQTGVPSSPCSLAPGDLTAGNDRDGDNGSVEDPETVTSPRPRT